MILYPPMSELAAKAGSRYLLVNLVARRARNIAAAAQAAGEPLDTKPVSMAIDEVYDCCIQVVHKEYYILGVQDPPEFF